MKNKILKIIAVVGVFFLIFFLVRNSKFIKANELNAIGIEKSQKKEFEESDLDFYKSISYKFREHIPITNLGINSMYKKDYSLAHEYFEKALLIKKDFRPAKYNDAVALFEWGNMEYDPKKCNVRRVMIFWNQSLLRFKEIVNSKKFFEFSEDPLIKKSKLDSKFVKQKIDELQNGCKPVQQEKNSESKNFSSKDSTDRSQDKSEEENDSGEAKKSQRESNQKTESSKNQNQNAEQKEKSNETKNQSSKEKDHSEMIKDQGEDRFKNNHRAEKKDRSAQEGLTDLKKFADSMEKFLSLEPKKDQAKKDNPSEEDREQKDSHVKPEHDQEDLGSLKNSKLEKSGAKTSKSPLGKNHGNSSSAQKKESLQEKKDQKNFSNESETITEFMEREYGDRKISQIEKEKIQKELLRIQDTSYKQKYYRSRLEKPEKERTTEENRQLLKGALW